MTSFNSREDFLRALEENPQWKEAVRALILGEELLQLPLQFRAFVGQVSSFIDQTEAFISEQRQFNTEQRQFNEGFTRRLGRIEVNIGNFRGSYAESAAVRNAVAIAAELGLEYMRSVTQEELVRMSRSATGDIPVNQLRSFWTADLIIETRDGADTHYIAVESSYTADQRDTDRLQRNVQFLTEFTGQSARAVVVSVRNDAYVSALVESGAVYWFQLEDRRPVPE
jgi:hypothetical protein